MLGTAARMKRASVCRSVRRHEQHGGLAGQLLALRRFGEPLLQAFCEAGLEARALRCRCRARQRALQQPLEVRLERDHRQLAANAGDVLHDLAAQRDAHLVLQRGRIRRARRVLGERLDDRADVA